MEQYNEAKQVYFRYNGSRFAMDRDGPISETVATFDSYGVPDEVLRAWDEELLADHLARLDQPGNWHVISFLMHRGFGAHLVQLTAQPPLGTLRDKFIYLECLLRYADHCSDDRPLLRYKDADYDPQHLWHALDQVLLWARPCSESPVRPSRYGESMVSLTAPRNGSAYAKIRPGAGWRFGAGTPSRPRQRRSYRILTLQPDLPLVGAHADPTRQRHQQGYGSLIGPKTRQAAHRPSTSGSVEGTRTARRRQGNEKRPSTAAALLSRVEPYRPGTPRSSATVPRPQVVRRQHPFGVIWQALRHEPSGLDRVRHDSVSVRHDEFKVAVVIR